MRGAGAPRGMGGRRRRAARGARGGVRLFWMKTMFARAIPGTQACTIV